MTGAPRKRNDRNAARTSVVNSVGSCQVAYWLEHVVKVERRPKTVQGCEGVIRRYLLPSLGRKRLDKLNAAEVRQFVTSLRTGCQCCQRGWDKLGKPPECCAKKGGEC
ncbi:hypothetical protein GCM10009530_77290 [Microbispora corallina]|uniref:Integrase SAM-like N-terminal domain-containing protein n=1 Tax=Microbispora corallina TaxID=83302 RepID=A0ABQ4GCE9_9ACTN|nr:N-terminal phage integrase SAM-like domain-containing protein [Microbispora corallina]GIH44744.1 hypothetical protein Mco01_77440 [Microbispora corallina]